MYICIAQLDDVLGAYTCIFINTYIYIYNIDARNMCLACSTRRVRGSGVSRPRGARGGGADGRGERYRSVAAAVCRGAVSTCWLVS